MRSDLSQNNIDRVKLYAAEQLTRGLPTACLTYRTSDEAITGLPEVWRVVDPKMPTEDEGARDAWFGRAMPKLAPFGAIVLDPTVGLEPVGSPATPQHALRSEVTHLLDTGAVRVVCFQAVRSWQARPESPQEFIDKQCTAFGDNAPRMMLLHLGPASLIVFSGKNFPDAGKMRARAERALFAAERGRGKYAPGIYTPEAQAEEWAETYPGRSDYGQAPTMLDYLEAGRQLYQGGPA